MRIYEPLKSDLSINHVVTKTNKYVQQVVESELSGPHKTISERLSSVSESLRHISASSPTTFPVNSEWVVAIPETAEYIGISFMMTDITATDMDNLTQPTLSMYAVLLGCIITNDIYQPITMLPNNNFFKAAQTLKVFGEATQYLLRYPIPGFDTYAVPTQMMVSLLPLGITHIAILKQFYDSTANPLPAGTLKTNIRFW